MTPETAEMVFYASTGTLGLVWLLGSFYAMSRTRPDSPRDAYSPVAASDNSSVSGEVTVRGDITSIEEKLADRIASLGEKGGRTFLKITDRSSGKISFERVPGSGPGFDSGQVTLEPDGDRVRIRYSVSLARFMKIMRLVANLVCYVYGGLFVIGTPLLVWYLVLQSADESVRGQVFQIIQMVHGVWPPFLIGFIVGRIRKATVAQFEAMLANTEHAS